MKAAPNHEKGGRHCATTFVLLEKRMNDFTEFDENYVNNLSQPKPALFHILGKYDTYQEYRIKANDYKYINIEAPYRQYFDNLNQLNHYWKFSGSEDISYQRSIILVGENQLFESFMDICAEFEIRYLVILQQTICGTTFTCLDEDFQIINPKNTILLNQLITAHNSWLFAYSMSCNFIHRLYFAGIFDIVSREKIYQALPHDQTIECDDICENMKQKRYSEILQPWFTTV